MALCINQSGTYRNITTLCINQSGTYRNITTGCINQSGTYRLFGFESAPFRGDSYGGGFLICKQAPNLRWVVSPRSTEVSRDWYNRDDARWAAYFATGCFDWFVPTCGQLHNPGFVCRSFWGPSPCYSSDTYWSSTEVTGYVARAVNFNFGGPGYGVFKLSTMCVRAFRCVTY